ncbi:MAG: succinylglutamate desuccinylase/aspartoacylase family protein [Candidatus Pacebacteria bacterium]|nr:succinylglutamate desuccinylase/aspartoacylase family protein [Candidatus Paceibacterota bacterium]MCD8508019.1 succinylglutamate desuccinylase/aspartoacylase family protein [Candidatus Paceibacterota bacterium]MCD8528248.1 succinylglutamate desuccinylase/aspartoacylase family protein [Candidatus Paceibacterota bacterium]MCD8563799.1 succinylglutamate desuccinylase/aspartoacylase family protein [Candidatus Paceibacterota bacterium]
MQEIITLQGKEAGPTSVILVGVHGNEPCGVRALEHILPNLTLTRGTVHVLLGNPRAYQKGVRFTEMNLNRAFQEDTAYTTSEQSTYEYQRSREIMQYLDKATALLDIHSAQAPTAPFIFCDERALALAKESSPDVATYVLDVEKFEQGGTDGYMSRKGDIGICIECGQHDDPQAVDVAERAVRAFLGARNHIPHTPNEESSPLRKYFTVQYAYHTQTDTFTLVRDIPDFTHISTETCIGYDGDIPVYAPRDGYVLFARNQYKAGTEGFLLATYTEQLG